jgi:hypothetical protein
MFTEFVFFDALSFNNGGLISSLKLTFIYEINKHLVPIFWYFTKTK